MSQQPFICNFEGAAVDLRGLIAIEKTYSAAQEDISFFPPKMIEIEPEQFKVALYYEKGSEMAKRFKYGSFVRAYWTKEERDAAYNKILDAWEQFITPDEDKPQSEQPAPPPATDEQGEPLQVFGFGQ